MITLTLSLLFACGAKDADTAEQEQTQEVDTAEDTASSEEESLEEGKDE